MEFKVAGRTMKFTSDGMLTLPGCFLVHGKMGNLLGLNNQRYKYIKILLLEVLKLNCTNRTLWTTTIERL